MWHFDGGRGWCRPNKHLLNQSLKFSIRQYLLQRHCTRTHTHTRLILPDSETWLDYLCIHLHQCLMVDYCREGRFYFAALFCLSDLVWGQRHWSKKKKNKNQLNTVYSWNKKKANWTAAVWWNATPYAEVKKSNFCASNRGRERKKLSFNQLTLILLLAIRGMLIMIWVFSCK